MPIFLKWLIESKPFYSTEISRLKHWIKTNIFLEWRNIDSIFKTFNLQKFLEWRNTEFVFSFLTARTAAARARWWRTWWWAPPSPKVRNLHQEKDLQFSAWWEIIYLCLYKCNISLILCLPPRTKTIFLRSCPCFYFGPCVSVKNDPYSHLLHTSSVCHVMDF